MGDKEEKEIATMFENLQKTTGKSQDDWLRIARDSGLSRHSELVTFLKEKYGIGHGYANMIAHSLNRSAATMSDAPQQLVDQQYSGGKAVLRPIYDRLVEAIRAFGDDVEFVPMKAYVSVKRGKQFALLQPSTTTRFDVGIKLKGVVPHGRLEDGATFTTMVTHRVKVSKLADVDDQLIGWLRQAYDSAG